jgi:hypothetical protein
MCSLRAGSPSATSRAPATLLFVRLSLSSPWDAQSARRHPAHCACRHDEAVPELAEAGSAGACEFDPCLGALFRPNQVAANRRLWLSLWPSQVFWHTDSTRLCAMSSIPWTQTSTNPSKYQPCGRYAVQFLRLCQRTLVHIPPPPEQLLVPFLYIVLLSPVRCYPTGTARWTQTKPTSLSCRHAKKQSYSLCFPSHSSTHPPTHTHNAQPKNRRLLTCRVTFGKRGRWRQTRGCFICFICSGLLHLLGAVAVKVYSGLLC